MRPAGENASRSDIYGSPKTGMNIMSKAKQNTKVVEAAPKAAAPKTLVKKPLRHASGKAASLATHGYHAMDNYLTANAGSFVAIAKLAEHVRDVLTAKFGTTGDVLAAAENAVVHQLPIDAGFGRKSTRCELTGVLVDGKPFDCSKRRPPRAALLAGRVRVPVGTKPRAYRLSLADAVTQRPFGKAAE